MSNTENIIKNYLITQEYKSKLKMKMDSKQIMNKDKQLTKVDYIKKAQNYEVT